MIKLYLKLIIKKVDSKLIECNLTEIKLLAYFHPFKHIAYSIAYSQSVVRWENKDRRHFQATHRSCLRDFFWGWKVKIAIENDIQTFFILSRIRNCLFTTQNPIVWFKIGYLFRIA